MMLAVGFLQILFIKLLFQINDINTLKVGGKVVVEGIKKKKPKCVLNITF